MPDQAPASLAAALRRRYTIQHELGRGGTAFVFLAHVLKHDRPVAIKVLRPEIAVLLGVERFLREIRLAAQLHHPHIMPLYDSGEASGSLYYVMPYVAGQSLRQRLEREGQLPLDDAVRIARDVCDALSYAHGQDIVHRDIKPENILLDAGHALVADFGLARAIAAAGGDRLSETGMTVGTPAYMSPEQAGAEARVDGRSDVYSLGCVLYEMLAGTPPFTGPSAQALLARHALDPVPPLRTVRKAVPVQVERVVMKALEKVPADRFATAAQFAEALAAPHPSGRRPFISRRTGVLAASAILLAAAGWLTVNARNADAPAIRSIAVLPLENLMGDSTQDFLVDGMHEALVAELAQIQALKIISRTSMLRYRGTSKSIPEIARELGVDAVVGGSVFRAGDTLRVTTQLIDARTDRHLWAGTYLRDLRDVLRLHGDLATGIAEQIRVAVTPAERGRLATARQVDAGVLIPALKGQYECWRWTEAGLRRGVQLLRQAIDRDPTYAPAYARLAMCYADLALFGFEPGSEMHPRAKTVVQRAIELDSTLGEAYGVLGNIRFVYDLDFSGPDRDFRRALELSPGDVTVLLNYSFYLTLVGRFNEAIRMTQRAIELDPLGVNTSLSLGWTYFYARRYDDAIAQLRRTLELEPGYWWAHMELGWSYLKTGMHQEAVAHCDSAVARAHAEDAGVVSGCGWVYAGTGRRQQAEEILEHLRAGSTRQVLDPIEFSAVYLGLNDRDRALEVLRQAARERSPHLVFLKAFPMLDPLRSDPRFQALLRELKIEP